MKKYDKITISDNDKLTLIGNMSTMLVAGLPIIETVNSLLEDAKGNLKVILTVFLDDMMQGEHLHVSLAKFPRVFDKVTVNIIKASEASGSLDGALVDLRKTIQKSIEFHDRIMSAVMYPAFVMVVFSFVLLSMLVFVVPKMNEIFVKMKVDLPLQTKILVFLSDLIVSQTVTFLVMTAILIALMIFLYKRNRLALTSFFFSFPLIRDLVKLIDITVISRSLHLMLSSGIPITQAIDLCKDSALKSETRKLLEKASVMIYGGHKLSEGLRSRKGYIPSLMVKLVEAGEKTGTLEKSMLDISEYFDYQVSTTLKTMTTLLEPIMLVTVGVVVGGMMLSILSPIYGLIGQVGKQ